MKSETPQERQSRIEKQVASIWPGELSPNKLLNVILDITRGDQRFASDDDRLEAIDALCYKHLEVSQKGWRK